MGITYENALDTNPKYANPNTHMAEAIPPRLLERSIRVLEWTCLFRQRHPFTGPTECSHQCPHFTFFTLPLPTPPPHTPSPHLLRRNPSHGADTAVGIHPGIVDTYLAGHFFKTQGVAWTGGRGAWAGRDPRFPRSRGRTMQSSERRSRSSTRRWHLRPRSRGGTSYRLPAPPFQPRCLFAEALPSGRDRCAPPATAEYRGLSFIRPLLSRPIPWYLSSRWDASVSVWGMALGDLWRTKTVQGGGGVEFKVCVGRGVGWWGKGGRPGRGHTADFRSSHYALACAKPRQYPHN